MSDSTASDRTVYVGNLDPRVTKEQIYEIFIQLSPVSKIRYPKDKVLQTYQGYAFVEFATEQDLQYVQKLVEAAQSGNLIRLYDRWLKIRKVDTTTTDNKSQQNLKNIDDIPFAKLTAEGLDDTIEIKTLNRVFSKFGKFIQPIELLLNDNAGNTSANIYYNRYPDADAALLAMNESHIGNTRIKVKYSKKPAGQKGRYGNSVDRLLNKEAETHGLL